jgi:DMSO/TMAO reductase YedYZ heme-binding membrane subunit
MTRPSNAAAVILLRYGNTKATTEPKHLSIAVTTHSIQLLMGFLVSPSPTDNVCDVPHRRALGLNGITFYTNHLTDTRHATIGATQYCRLTDSLVHCRPYPVSKEWCPLDTPDKV